VSDPPAAEQAANGFAPPAGQPSAQSPIEQLYDAERPELAVAAAFAGGLVFAILLRRLRS
jgi:hypothetical protein